MYVRMYVCMHACMYVCMHVLVLDETDFILVMHGKDQYPGQGIAPIICITTSRQETLKKVIESN